MAGPYDWSVKIVPTADGKSVAFQPNLPKAKPGDTLYVQNTASTDTVVWRNDTASLQQPWLLSVVPTPPAGVTVPVNVPLCDPIPPNAPSSVQYVVPQGLPVGTVLTYCSKNNPAAIGTITIAAI